MSHNNSLMQLTTLHLYPLCCLITLCALLRIFFDTYLDDITPLTGRILYPLSLFIIIPVIIMVFSKLVTVMCEKLEVSTQLERAALLVSYAATPTLIGLAVALLLGFDSPVKLGALYSRVRVYLGSEPGLGIRGQNKVILIVGCALCGVIMSLVLRLVLDPLISL
jgi:hypothetical protein